MHEDDVAAELRRVLDATATDVDAAHGVPHPDRADLDRRIRRRARRRTGAAAVAGVLLLAAGVTGGAVVASRSSDGSGPTGVAAGGTTTPTAPPPGVSVPDDVRLPEVDGSIVLQSRRTSATAWTADGRVRRLAGSIVARRRAGTPTDRPSATVFVRTTPDGTRLDVRANRFGSPDAAAPTDLAAASAPSGACVPAGELYVGVRTDAAVGQVRDLRYDEVPAGTVVASGSVVGVAEGEPRWVVVAQVAPGVSDVRATFPDGHRDHLAPVDGIVVLTARVADGFDLATVDTAASPLRIEAVDQRDVVAAKTASVAGTCVPTRLPAPGAEQPADPAAARAAVESAWSTVFLSPLTDTAPLDAIDDPRGVAAARARAGRPLPAGHAGGHGQRGHRPRVHRPEHRGRAVRHPGAEARLRPPGRPR